ncbi:hypothetical protein [uncultured Thomasclavelia sp.]|nr:hypothetical protein [uncultured Thomasclavelia sp.]
MEYIYSILTSVVISYIIASQLFQKYMLEIERILDETFKDLKK